MNEKKYFDWKIIAIALLAVGLVVCLVRLSTLEHTRERLSATVATCLSEIRSLRGEIGAIYDRVDEQLKREASLLAGSDHTVGELDPDAATAIVTLSVVPKALTEDMTVTVSLDGRTTELARSGSTFAGTLAVGLFVEPGQVPLLTIETEAGTKSEYLEDMDLSYLFGKFLPTLSVDMSGSGTYVGGRLTEKRQLSVNGLPAGSGVAFTSFIRIEEVNGRQIAREDITAAVKQAGGSYNEGYEKTFEIAEGDDLRIYVVAEDSLGYIHKTLAHRWYVRDGATAETVYGGESIYDKNGVLLWGEKS